MGMKILGIESSCDETAAAIINVSLESQPCVLASTVYSQTDEHLAYGGVVPEIASRAHMERIQNIVAQCVDNAGISLNDIDGIAVTSGPGLLGGLIIGTTFAQALSMSINAPIIGVNHLEGHALMAHLTEDINFPYTLLLASGGHCQFINVVESNELTSSDNESAKSVDNGASFMHYEELGGTLDDAIGECFDKVAKMLDLPYPGGPQIEKLSAKGDAKKYAFPVPLRDGSVNFSFSGLKSAVRREILNISNISEQDVSDICASFQETVAKILVYKCEKAIKITGTKQFVLSGGVAANKLLRSRLSELCGRLGVTFHAPPVHLCTDNAVMIAYAGGLRLLKGESSQRISLKPRWPLNTL